MSPLILVESILSSMGAIELLGILQFMEIVVQCHQTNCDELIIRILNLKSKFMNYGNGRPTCVFTIFFTVISLKAESVTQPLLAVTVMLLVFPSTETDPTNPVSVTI